jgi:hypothetical protein
MQDHQIEKWIKEQRRAYRAGTLAAWSRIVKPPTGKRLCLRWRDGVVNDSWSIGWPIENARKGTGMRLPI